MKCGQRALTLISLAFGLLATGALSLAVATDFWLFTSEPPPKLSSDSIPEMEMEDMEDLPDIPMEDYYYVNDSMYPDSMILVHSGLWRMCMYYEGMPAPMCSVINFFDQDWERVTDADTTWSILRAIRKSSLVITSSLLLMIVAFSLSTLGNTKKDRQTISGAVIYIFAALCLGVGVILYISAVNDEVSHRKKPVSADGGFEYHYGWAFFFAGSAFISSMAASVTNITLYLKRYPTIEEMVNIIPGLEKKHNFDFSKVSSEDEPDTMTGSQNPTIIL